MLKQGFLLIFTLLLTACSLSPLPTRPINKYALINMHPHIVIKHAQSSKNLLVLTPVASPGYESSDMIYLMMPYNLRAYADNRWVAPPAQMMLPILAQKIRNLSYFKSVVTAPFSGQSNYVLDTRLLILQQEFLRPTSQVRLLMQATLLNSATSQVVASRRFQTLVNAPSNDPYGCVLATNRAVNSISKQIAKFVVNSM